MATLLSSHNFYMEECTMNYDEEFDDETVDTNELDETVDESVDGDSSDEDVKIESTSKKKAGKTAEQESDDESIAASMLENENYFTEDPSWKGTRYFQLDKRIVHVAFSKFFGKEAKDYEDFITSCVSKKAYHKMMRLFCHTNNVILNYDKKVTEAFIYKYYCIKHNIDNAVYQKGSYQQFVNAIINLFDFNIMNQIRRYVNECYIPSGDDTYEANKRTFIPSITFLDYHKKILFIVSEMTHFIIPLCLEYLREYKETNTNELLTDVFVNLFPMAQAVDPIHLIPIDKNERPCDVYQKLYSFVENKVVDSLKSDGAQWERQEILATIYKSVIEDIVNNKLLINIVPEYSYKYNIIHLNISVVRKGIQDLVIRKKDPFSINCFVDVDSNTSDDDNAIVTEAEQFDSYNAKHDEFPIIIRHVFMDDTVNKILMRKNVVLNPADVKFYMDHMINSSVVGINDFQRFVIMSCFHSQFGGSENLYGLNGENWVKLMLCCVEMFKRGGPETAAMAKYITAKRERHYVSRKETRLARNVLLNDPLYNYVIDTKYKNVKNVINKKNNFIESKITYLLSNEFSYNTPNEELNGRIIPRNEEEIRTGVLKFFSTFVL